MPFNHITDVQLFVKKISVILRPYNCFLVGDSAIYLLNRKIPQYFQFITDAEIHELYKRFDKIYHVNLTPFSFACFFEDQLLFFLKVNRERGFDLLQSFNKYYLFNKSVFLLPIVYDPIKRIFRNINLFHYDIFKENKLIGIKQDNLSYYSRYAYILSEKNKLNSGENLLGINNQYEKQEKIEIDRILECSSITSWLNACSNDRQITPFPYIAELFFTFTSYESKKLIDIMSEEGILIKFFPMLKICKQHNQTKEYHPEGTLYDHLVFALKALETKDFSVMVATLLHDVGKVQAYQAKSKGNKPKYPNHANLSLQIIRKTLKAISEELPFINDFYEKTTYLIENHMYIAFLPVIDENKKNDILKSPYLNDLLKLLKADIKASTDDLSNYQKIASYVQKNISLPL
jgi:hypothetical protein